MLDAIAAVEGTSPAEFDRPLYDVIDPDALDAVFRSAETNIRIEFVYLGYELTVNGTGEIHVELSDG